MAKQVFTRNRIHGIADYPKQIPFTSQGQAAAYLVDSVAFMRAIDYRTDPMAVTLLPSSLKESGATITDLLKWGEVVQNINATFQAGNVVPNPSFETGTAGWGFDADYTRSNEKAHDGTWSMKQQSTGGFENLTTENSPTTGIPVTPNTSYNFSFWAFITVHSGYSPAIQLNSIDAFSGNLVYTGMPDTGGQWQKFSYNVNVGNTNKVYIRIFNNTGTVTAYYDSFSITQLSTMNTYAYGNTGNIYERSDFVTSASWSLLHQAPQSHGNGMAWFAADNYLYYTTDTVIGRYGPIGSLTPQFQDNFLAAEGGIPQNTASINVASASSQYMTAADSASLSITGDLTLETYVKLATLPVVGASMSLIAKWDESTNHRSYKLDLYGVSGFFGAGSDGAITISANTTDAPIDSACSGTAGTQTLLATNPSFAVGQIIFIWQVQGTNAGFWERNIIQGYTAGTITLGTPLIGNYSGAAQVIVVKQYTNVTVNTGVTWQPKAWNGTTGGLLIFLYNGTMTVNGTISTVGQGFRGGAGSGACNCPSNPSYTGEGTAGPSVFATFAANGNAGGGTDGSGMDSGPGGGGGENAGGATAGQPGQAFEGGQPGQLSGSNDLTTFCLPGAGGGGRGEKNGNGNGGNGANAPGNLAIWGVTFIMGATGLVNLSGSNGNDSNPITTTDGAGGGGASAGGSCLLKFQTGVLGTNQIIAPGGTGGRGGASGTNFRSNGGNGGVGRIHLDYLSSFTGSTSPNINATQDNTLVTTTTIQARLGISNDGTSFEYLTQNLNSLTANAWNRISVSWLAASSLATFYYNAVPIGTATGTKTSINDNASLLYIGADKTSVVADFLNGELNDTRIWNQVETASQIFNQNNIQLAGTEAGLVAYYKFNNARTDSTGNANNLTDHGGTTFTTDVPFSASSVRLDIDQSQVGVGDTYTLLTAISETSANSLPFTPADDPQKSMSFNIAAIGTGDWTLTIHDQQNNVIASVTVLNGQLNTGIYEFIFASPWRIVLGRTYHAHLTSTVGDGTVVSTTHNNISTATFTTYFQYLVTDTAYHPVAKMLNFLAFGNERYIATWDGAFYNPTQIAFPPQTHVRCFGYWREFLAIGTWRERNVGTPNIYDWNQGRIYFWDGISQTFNFYVDVPEGQINALYGEDYSLYAYAGWTGQLLVYQGNPYSEAVTEQAVKVKKIPLQARGDTMEIYPSAMTMYRTLIHIGVSGITNSATVQQGVYSWGSTNQLYPETLSYDYVISTGNKGNTVSIGLVMPFGKSLLIGWQDGNSFGCDIVDFNNNPPASNGTIEFLIQDNSDAKGSGIWKNKALMALLGSYLPLQSGQSVSVKYKLDREKNWHSFTDNAVGSTGKKYNVSPGRCIEYQVAMDINVDTTVTTNSPTILGMSAQYDDLKEEDQFG